MSKRDKMPRAIIHFLNFIRVRQSLINPVSANIPFFEHLIKMFGKFHTQTITPLLKSASTIGKLHQSHILIPKQSDIRLSPFG